MVQHVKRNQVLKEGDEVFYEETEAAPAQRMGRRKRNAPVLGSARQLRRIYQTYLEYVNTQGMSIGKADTSKDVLERSKQTRDLPEAVRLRELYIAARYGDPDAVTRDQVDEAQRCLETILKGKKTAGQA